MLDAFPAKRGFRSGCVLERYHSRRIKRRGLVVVFAM
ncbi:hypothetical protein EDP1_3758 [Pseudomonas putida S610]|nr:hypothetical protein EDP1_3758 [Pseudomonas putida S610]